MQGPSISALLSKQDAAQSYEQWFDVSRQLDDALGLETWKCTDEEPGLYDCKKVQNALDELSTARKAEDMRKLLYIVRTGFSRNIGNMGNPLLYLECNCGTKHLIERYISECELAIKTLMESADISDEELLSTIIQTRKAYGRTALVLSGGSILGFLHSGVLYELCQMNLLPRIISGSSAGAIFASLICTHRDDELDDVWQLRSMPLRIFEGDEPESLMMHLKRFLKYGTWIDSSHLIELLKSLLGEDTTFQEAYNRTGRILNVTVSDAGIYEMPKLLNYLTAPNVLIWSAVSASCSVPLFFASNVLMAKNPRTKEMYPWSKAAFIDGSVDNDLPLTRLAEMFNVNHFIACQVNPHISPLLRISDRIFGSKGSAFVAPVYFMGQSTGLDPGYHYESVHPYRYQPPSLLTKWFQTCQSIILGEFSHALVLANKVGIMPRATSALLKVMAQDYVGNVTILPEIGWRDVIRLFKNPTSNWQDAAWQRGRRAVWPKLALVRNHCAIELALDRAVVQLRIRIIGSAATANRWNSHSGIHPTHSSTSLSTTVKLKHGRRHSDDFLYGSHTTRHMSTGEIETSPQSSYFGLRKLPSTNALPELPLNTPVHRGNVSVDRRGSLQNTPLTSRNSSHINLELLQKHHREKLK